MSSIEISLIWRASQKFVCFDIGRRLLMTFWDFFSIWIAISESSSSRQNQSQLNKHYSDSQKNRHRHQCQAQSRGTCKVLLQAQVFVFRFTSNWWHPWNIPFPSICQLIAQSRLGNLSPFLPSPFSIHFPFKTGKTNSNQFNFSLNFTPINDRKFHSFPRLSDAMAVWREKREKPLTKRFFFLLKFIISVLITVH